MNRTEMTRALLSVLLAAAAVGQEPAPAAPQPAEDAFVKELVGRMQKAEAAATSVHMELETTGSFPGGMTFETRGSLRVLRGEHPRLHARMEFTFEDGLAGRLETLKTPDGVWILEDNPTFGEVFLVMDRALVADLEWAARVLGRADDVPGVDRRAAAPLGSGMVEDLGRQYRLAELSRGERDGQPGRWVGGDLRPSTQPESDPDLLLPDRVELFVRDGDSALLDVVHLHLGKPVQRISVRKLEVNRPLDPASFGLQVGDRKARPVREHLPAWSQIERILAEADAKAGADDLRPSRREQGGGTGR